MVKRKTRSSKPRSIKLKRRSRKRKGYPVMYRVNNVLDTSISVRGMLKYLGLAVSFLVVFFCIFMLGRASVDGLAVSDVSSEQGQLSGETRQFVKSDDSAGDADVEKQDVSQVSADEDVTDLPGQVDQEEYEDGEPVNSLYRPAETVLDEEEDGSGEERLVSSCTNRVAEFDYNYSSVDIVVSNFQRELKGDNWGTVTAVKLSITNREECTIINPTKVKIKMNAKGKGSVWWDDDVFLPDSFSHMLPGTTVEEIIPIHVSYSDVYSEKDFRLTVFDDYGIPIGTFKEYITLP
jgi:hypothetical protein